jgi:hypothetical protein
MFDGSLLKIYNSSKKLLGQVPVNWGLYHVQHSEYAHSAVETVTVDELHCCMGHIALDTENLLVNVRGHLSVSLLPLSSPTLLLFIFIHPPHLCTILKDYNHSRWLLGPIIRRLSRSRLTNSRRLPASPPARTSTASDGLRTHWDRSA